MQQILHKNYTSYGGTFQPSLLLNFEFQIKKDDPVRLLLQQPSNGSYSSLQELSACRAESRITASAACHPHLRIHESNLQFPPHRGGMPKGHPLHVSARRATRTGSHNHCPFSQGSLCPLRQGDSGTNGIVSCIRWSHLV